MIHIPRRTIRIKMSLVFLNILWKLPDDIEEDSEASDNQHENSLNKKFISCLIARHIEPSFKTRLGIG